MLEALLDTSILASGTDSNRALSHSFLVVTFLNIAVDENRGLLDGMYFLMLNCIEHTVVQYKDSNRINDIVIVALAFMLKFLLDESLGSRQRCENWQAKTVRYRINSNAPLFMLFV